jgi:hypothetical protein
LERVLVFSHTTGYQLRAFNDAADALGIELRFATDRCHRLDDPWQDRAVPVRFHDLETSIAAIVGQAEEFPVRGVIAVGDRPVILAARAADALGIEWHSVAGAIASTDKRRSRAALSAAGLPSPAFAVLSMSDTASPLPFPVVLKPLGLSGSRGVIRANDAGEFAAAFARIRALLTRPEVLAARTGLEDQILVEEYIDGREFAVEGVLTHGALRVFAVFDKPDPLEGPFFEETIYVTPSPLTADADARIVARVGAAAAAVGLSHGPVHAECRITASGEVYVLEVAARPIGGLCSRVLSFTRASGPSARAGNATETPVSLETILLEHALGRPIDGYVREQAAAAVMMIPIPRRGVYKGVAGHDGAREVAGVTDVRITAKEGQLLEPLPEAGSYLGFIFARGDTPGEAEGSVRAAHQRLDFAIARELAVKQPEPGKGR